MEIDLLEEIAVGLGALGARIARVPEALAVLRPGDGATGGRELDAGDRLVDLLGRSDIVDMKRAVLAAVPRQRHRDFAAVEGRREPVHRGQALGIQDVGIEYRFARRRIGGGVQRHQHGLLEGRVAVDREHFVALRVQMGIGGRGRLDQLGELVRHLTAIGQRIEIGTGARILRLAPRLHLGIVPVLQPAIGVGNGHALDRVDGRSGIARRRRRDRGCDGSGGQDRDGKQDARQVSHENSPEQRRISAPAPASNKWETG